MYLNTFSDYLVYGYKKLSGILTNLLFLSLSQVLRMDKVLVIFNWQNFRKINRNLEGLAWLCALKNTLSLLIFYHTVRQLWGFCILMVSCCCPTQSLHRNQNSNFQLQTLIIWAFIEGLKDLIFPWLWNCRNVWGRFKRHWSFSFLRNLSIN